MLVSVCALVFVRRTEVHELVRDEQMSVCISL